MSTDHESLREACPTPFWLDSPRRPPAHAPLFGSEDCDLAVVGAGFTGLWAALLHKQRHPDDDVVVLEAVTAGWAASGRNGGFCMATLTHGPGNGEWRFPEEQQRLEELGRRNLDAIQETVERYAIDCDWQRTGELMVATRPWEVADLEEGYELSRRLGLGAQLLDREALQALVHSPIYLAGLWDREGCAMVDPARLAWGLRRACEELGVRFFDGTPVHGLSGERGGVLLTAPGGTVWARRVVLATNAFRPLLRRLRTAIVPVYDYALMTEPLSAAQREAIGWKTRFGLADHGNQFHYYRLTEDGRMLWGGYDAVYHYGSRLAPSLDQRPRTFQRLARHFSVTFPQLEGVRFTHAWGGAIDTCARLFCFWGTALRGRVAYALGYTGMGVGESRFGALVCLDLLEGGSDLTELQLVRTRPVPFPPEPLRAAVIQTTRLSLACADANGGRRNAWLRTLDRMGLGFDS